MNKLVAWPDKLYACTRHWGNPETLSVFRGCANVLTFPVRQSNMQTIEYIRADLAQPQFTPEQLQSVLYTIMKCQDMARYERDYSLQDELTEAIALLKGMK